MFVRNLGYRIGLHRGIGDFCLLARLFVSLLWLCNAVIALLLLIKLERLSVLYQEVFKFNVSFSEKFSKACEINMFISSHIFVVSLAFALHILMANHLEMLGLWFLSCFNRYAGIELVYNSNGPVSSYCPVLWLNFLSPSALNKKNIHRHKSSSISIPVTGCLHVTDVALFHVVVVCHSNHIFKKLTTLSWNSSIRITFFGTDEI